jgi:uncharacterized protein with HEPN domain
MPRRPERSRSERLEDILQWGAKTGRYIGGMSAAEFAQDLKTIDAVSRCIEVIGEAASCLLRDFPEVLARHPDLELPAARAMRNRLSHGYFAIDVQVVWDTATVDVPKIVAAARAALSAETTDVSRSDPG